MRAHKLKVDIPEDHHLEVVLPRDFPSGPAEIIVLATAQQGRVVSLGGVLAPDSPPEPEEDGIAAEIEALRRERDARFSTFNLDTK